MSKLAQLFSITVSILTFQDMCILTIKQGASPMRRLGGIFPLHGVVHKKECPGGHSFSDG